MVFNDGTFNDSTKEEIYKKSFIDLIRNVDISCCGLSYSLDNGLEEYYKNAILHAHCGVFSVNKKSQDVFY
jgi:hypothetical protein